MTQENAKFNPNSKAPKISEQESMISQRKSIQSFGKHYRKGYRF